METTAGYRPNIIYMYTYYISAVVEGWQWLLIQRWNSFALS